MIPIFRWTAREKSTFSFPLSYHFNMIYRVLLCLLEYLSGIELYLRRHFIVVLPHLCNLRNILLSHTYSNAIYFMFQVIFHVSYTMSELQSGYCYLKLIFCFVFRFLLQIPYVVKGTQELKEHSVKVFLITYKPYIFVWIMNVCINLDWIKLSCNLTGRNIQQRKKK